MTLAERLKFLRKINGLKSKSDAASAIGIQYGTYQRWEYGEAPNRNNFKKIAGYYKCSLSWLMTGDGEPFPGARNKYPDACGPESPIHIQPDFPSDDFVFIRQVNGKISAGDGRMPDESVDVMAAFRRDWIKRKGGKPERMSLIKIEGDSMEPTLLAGDLVLIDHCRTTIAANGGIYAVSLNDEIMIKRIQPIYPDKLLIISDNEHYHPREISVRDVRVNGKVIWYARDLEK